MIYIEQDLLKLFKTVGNAKILNETKSFFKKDVEAYARKLNELESQIKRKELSLEVAIKKYHSHSKRILQRADELEDEIKQKTIIKKIKEIFRKTLIDSPVYRSRLIRRAIDKPKGYPGDYQMIEFFYENKAISKGIGYCGDAYILRDDYVVAVRNRKDKMKEILKGFITSSKLSVINILNLGCGSCREIRELFDEGFKSKSKLVFTLLDQEIDALNFAKKNFQEIVSVTRNIQFKFISEDVGCLFNEKYMSSIKQQNLIYSIGLADYLHDIVLSKLVKTCFKLLAPQGKLIIAHKNVRQYKTSAPDWFCNWYFFSRDKKELIFLVETCLTGESFKLEFIEERTNRVFFIVINKL